MNLYRHNLISARRLLAQAFMCMVLLVVGAGYVQARTDDQAREDYEHAIRLAQQADTTYSRIHDQLVQASRWPGLLLRTESGGYFSISDDDVERLAAAVAVRGMVLGTDSRNPYRLDMSGRSQLEVAIDMLEASMIASFGGANESGAIPKEKLAALMAVSGDFLRDELRRTLEQYDRENRAKIEEELQRIKRQQQWLGEMVVKADALRQRALPRGAENGFLNKAGFYVVKVAGSGWLKRYAGYARWSEGYQHLIIKVEDRVGVPKNEGNYWSFPTGVDIRAVFNDWQEDTRQRSVKACKDSPPNCPCAPMPSIWTTGPEYTVMQGPFKTISEARAVAGDPYVDNGKPGATKFWTLDGDRRINEVTNACRAMGAQ